MAFNIICLALVLAITFMHSIFGFFSGLINVFCAVVASAIALGFYESLNDLLTSSLSLHAAYTEPICLVVLFVLSLALLRAAADNLIRGNVQLPNAVNTAGAALCGFIFAQITVGILAIGILMLPLGGKVMQFSRYERTEERNPDQQLLAKFERRSLWTRPDEMTIGMFNLLSSGSLEGKTAFSAVYPNFADMVFYSTNTVQPESTPAPLRDGARKEDGFKGLTVLKWWEQVTPIEGRYRKEVPTPSNRSPNFERVDKFEPPPGQKFVVARVTLGRTASDKEKSSRRHLFRPTMIRLVGTLNGAPAQAFARVIGNADEKIQGANRIADLDSNFSMPGEDQTIEVYFPVDQAFQPRFVEYRRHARAPLDSATFTEKPPTNKLVFGAQAGGEESGGGGSSSGRLTMGRVFDNGSGQTHQLPFGIPRSVLSRMSGVTLDGNEFVSGRITGSRSRLTTEETNAVIVSDVKIPADYRLVSMRYKPKEAKSIVGDVFNYVGGNLNQYVAVDKNGNSYQLSGYYAIVKRGSDETFEYFLNGPPNNPADPGFRYMMDFKTIDRSSLEADDAEIGLLFYVPPNTRLVRIENQAKDGADVDVVVGG